MDIAVPRGGAGSHGPPPPGSLEGSHGRGVTPPRHAQLLLLLGGVRVRVTVRVRVRVSVRLTVRLRLRVA
jgi:hypothetical protein